MAGGHHPGPAVGGSGSRSNSGLLRSGLVVRGRKSGPCRSWPGPCDRARVALDAVAAVGLWDELRRHRRAGLHRKHLFHLEPGEGHTRGRQFQRRASCGQRHLGETRRGQHRLTVDLVVGQPWIGVGTHIALPDVSAP